MSTDYAIHSDFIVHWTGRDLDAEYDSEWAKGGTSTARNNTSLAQAYVDRLYNILKHGLWLTEESAIRFVVAEQEILIPSTPKVCFTELKLSESRVHARRYGRLGIGVKRPYLFNRSGRPLAYYGFNLQRHNDPFLRACAYDLKDKSLLNFFKPMNSGGSPLTYDLYSESEWRILYFQDLLGKRLLIDPRDERNTQENAYFRSLTTAEQAKLKYLAPLDGWFALVIYPYLRVKNRAQQEDSVRIRTEIARIKNNPNDHGNQVEKGNWPMEIDLDACQNF